MPLEQGEHEGRAAVLEAAIEPLTRARGNAADEVIAELIAERRVMREALDLLRCRENVVSLSRRHAKSSK